MFGDSRTCASSTVEELSSSHTLSFSFSAEFPFSFSKSESVSFNDLSYVALSLYRKVDRLVREI